MKNAIEAGIVLCESNVLKVDDIRVSGLPSMESGGDDETRDSFSLEEEKENLFNTTNFNLEETERITIIRALKQSGGVQKEAAKLLGISRRAIHYKIKKYDIDSAALRGRGQ